ncbi:MAG: DUF421 domain-containing protein, partial [Sporomusa sp.]
SLLAGRPSIIVENGQIVQSEMKKNRFTLDELTEELRKKNITDISTVQYAILETNGVLNTILYNEYQPICNGAMGVNQADTGLPIVVINDGRVLKNNLKILGLDENWLKKQLKERKIENHQNVFIMSVDGQRNIYFAQKS